MKLIAMDIFYKNVLSVLFQAIPEAERPFVEEQEDLIALGILDSFKVTEVLMYIEEWSGMEIQLDKLQSERVRSLSVLYALYKELMLSK